MKVYFRDRLILVSFFASLALNIILWVIVAGKFGISGERVPLHFNVVSGINAIGSAWALYQLPASGLIVFLINWVLGISIYEHQRLFSYFLGWTAVFAQAVLLMGILSLAAITNV